MRKIPLVLSCLLVLGSCQKEIDAGLPDNKENTVISFINCNCRLVSMKEEDEWGRKSYYLNYEGGKISYSVEMVNTPVAIMIDDAGIAQTIIPDPPAEQSFTLWEPEPVSFMYDPKGVLTAVASSHKTLAFEYTLTGKLWKIRRFNTGAGNGWTAPYQYFKPTFDAQGNIVLLKVFDMAGHQVGKIALAYTDVPNPLSAMTPFNFEKNLSIHSFFPLITYFVHKSKYLVSSITINNEPPIEWSYDLDASPKVIKITTGDGKVRRYYYECQ